MQPEFEAFLSSWRNLAGKGKNFRLPARSDITAADFHSHLPNMVIASWDMDKMVPQIVYCGNRIDSLIQSDVARSPLRALFEPGPFIAHHLEVAMTVMREQVGAIVEAELITGAGQTVPMAQLRLPLATDDDRPVIMSLFSFPDVAARAPGEAKAKIKNMRHRYLELVPAASKSTAV